MTKASYLLSFLDKETIIYQDLTKQKGLCLGQKTSEVVTVYRAFLALNSLTADKDTSYPPPRGRTPSHGRFIFSYFRAKEGG